MSNDEEDERPRGPIGIVHDIVRHNSKGAALLAILLFLFWLCVIQIVLFLEGVTNGGDPPCHL